MAVELKSNKFPNPIYAVDSMNCNAIHDAAVKGHIGPMRALVQLKADLTNVDSTEQKTCLHKAAEAGFVEAVKELINLKHDMNAMDRDRETARFFMQVGRYPIVTPARGELKTNRTYGLSVSGFYF